MDFNIFCKVKSIVEKYTKDFVFANNTNDLCLMLIADVKDPDKESILNEFDLIIPQGIIFPHEYENGRLKVKFKEVAQ